MPGSYRAFRWRPERGPVILLVKRMSMPRDRTETHLLPARRPFSWRALLFLVALQFLGNLASIPLLRATEMPVEPVSTWILWTAVSFLTIGLGLFLGARTGLGALLLEGALKGEKVIT
jgi:hypothetical protein